MNRELLVAIAVGIAVFAGMAHAEMTPHASEPRPVVTAVVVAAPHHNHARLHLFWSR